MDDTQNFSTKASAPQKRHTAKIVHIKDIHDGSYVKQEGWEPNFIQSTFSDQLFRVNIIGVIVEPPLQVEGLTQFSCTIDDGTGKIELRAFEEIKIDGNLDIGTPVLVVGKPREYNNVYYILPEIIRPIEKAWIDFRKKELEKLDEERDQKVMHQIRSTPKKGEEPKEPAKQKRTPTETPEFLAAKETFDDIDDDLADNSDSAENPLLIELIEKMDEGDGVLVTDLEAKMDDAEEKVTRLLLHGEIYEIKPGRVKVLK